MITANCRARLTGDDFDFVVRVLAKREGDHGALSRLFSDEQARDELLDDSSLVDAILDSPESLRISPHLYFYVLCRRVLKDPVLRDRAVADYIASLLEGFSRTQRLNAPEEMSEQDLHYVSDALMALTRATPREAFLVRTHLANCALFSSGLFSENIEKRTLRGAPGLAFYEEVGRMNFHLASSHHEAKRFGLDAIFRQLAGGFREARLALNQLAARLMHFEPAPYPGIG